MTHFAYLGCAADPGTNSSGPGPTPPCCPRSFHLLLQHRSGCGAEAGDDVVVNGNFILAAAELAKAKAFVDKRLGDLLAQRQFGCGAEACGEIVVGDDGILIAPELPERNALPD